MLLPPCEKLPIGIQSFAKIREGGFYYVDKTPFALRLSQGAGYFFLARPRRFGKSLFLDTLKELYEGNQALFVGLVIHDQWDWQVRHPVLRISFGSSNLRDKGALQATLHRQLSAYEQQFGLPARYPAPSNRLADLIDRLHRQTGQRVVVLVDEYDKPILDLIDQPAAARELREELKGLYSVLKDQDAHLHFVFLTGVSKFTKVSLFSGLNNLRDITLDPHFSALCGYTETDLDQTFTAELPGLERAQIKRWYNGYNWTGEAVYNPFDVLLLFENRKFQPWWYETGAPEFLVRLLAERGLFSPD
jgi:hypothetical protein